ncbi:hypothetical protein LG299_08220 [Microbacterium lacus]|uniref:hypothetical protein n=1 Tax=Microbacterium lacus TaxID=415217 RepID=UPI00384E328E
MEDPSTDPDADRELTELRARAYGPDSDIHTDPAAHARLIELEAAHLMIPATPPRTDPGHAPAAGAGQSAAATNVVVLPDRAALTDELPAMTVPTMPSQRDWRSLVPNATWMRRLALVAVASTAAATAFFALTWLLGPRPDATQQPIPAETEISIVDPLINQGVNPDIPTIHQYESYRGVKLWSVTDDRGYVCLAAWEQGLSGRFAFQCAPPGIEPLVDLAAEPEIGDGFGDWLPEGSFVRFQLHGPGVDVYLPPESEP